MPPEIMEADARSAFLDDCERFYPWGDICYLAVPFHCDRPVGGIWRIAVVQRSVKGYKPLPMEFWNGPDVSAFRAAFNWNKTRLHLGRRDVMFIIASALECAT